MRYMRLVIMLALSVLCSVHGFAQQGGSAASIQKGSQVSLDYTLTVDGKVVDGSAGRGPLHYTQGDGKMITGLSRQLEGLKVGDEKTIVVTPEEAYGMRDPKALREVPKTKMPQGVEPYPGMPLQVQNPNGSVSVVSIAEVKEDTVVVDFNHPLAGKILNFQIKVISIE